MAFKRRLKLRANKAENSKRKSIVEAF